tara:strand:- start:2887 stop:4149 length:1263 start_codon:yes stop_codon:yes gene_type:complete
MIDDGVKVDAVVTDPPYHLTSITERFGKEGSAPAQHGTDGAFARASRGFMGKEWDGGDIAFRAETWALCFELLKAGGHLLAFSGSRTYHRMAVAIEDAGFEIRDQIMWIYGSGFPKSLNIGKAIDKAAGVDREVIGSKIGQAGYSLADNGRTNRVYGNFHDPNAECAITAPATPEAQQWEGWGTALKPAHEPIVLARKPISEKSIADNVVKHGTGAINIDACRIDSDNHAKSRIRKAGSEFGQNSGWNDHENVDTFYDPSKGRYPANVIHDGSQEVMGLFPNTPPSQGSVRNNKPSKNIAMSGDNLGHKGYGHDDNGGSAARFFYCPKTSRAEREESVTQNGHDRNNTHPTVKPVELMRYLCRLVTPKGGTVLDPFMGSGSTGLAAKTEGMEFIGIEREQEYFDIATDRINKTWVQPDLI